MRKKKPFRKFISFCILLILVLVMLYSGLQILESTAFLKGEEAEQPVIPQKTITRNGIDYFPRQDLHVMLVLGIDQYGPAQASNYYRNEGSADSIMLLIFDEGNETCNVLYINRDTMLDMDVLGVTHEYAGTIFGQVALAHTYGSGMEDSCENVKNTLMNFMHGLTIDYYVSMRMEAVTILNDAVGGVTVNVVDDFSQVDSSIPMGEVTLMGDQVLNYVRTRKDVGDQKNLTRMERQKEYVAGFLEALREKEHEDADFVLKLYDEVAPYLVSDCPVSTMSNMMSKYLDYSINVILLPEERNVVEDGHYAFYVDEEKLDELIVQLFYVQK